MCVWPIRLEGLWLCNATLQNLPSGNLGQGEQGEAEGRAAAADGVVQLALRLDVDQLDVDDSLGGVADGEDQDKVDQVESNDQCDSQHYGG